MLTHFSESRCPIEQSLLSRSILYIIQEVEVSADKTSIVDLPGSDKPLRWTQEIAQAQIPAPTRPSAASGKCRDAHYDGAMSAECVDTNKG
jgi:hypothetical protein